MLRNDDDDDDDDDDNDDESSVLFHVQNTQWHRISCHGKDCYHI